MTVSELIEALKEMPQDALISTDKVILECWNCGKNKYVRIFKAQDFDFVNGYKVVNVYENGKESEE